MLHISVDTTAQQVTVFHEIPISGWAWSDKAGWISLNCMNDYDGDGDLEDGCVAGPWGLHVKNVDNQSYIQGCAYGVTGTNQNDTLGWICFSDPGGAIATQAPASGVSFSGGNEDYTYYTCDVLGGVCQANLLNPADQGTDIGRSCMDFSICSQDCTYIDPSDTVKHCQGTSRVCVDDKDCEYGCGGGPNNQYLMRGVCYNYRDESAYPDKEILKTTYDPFGNNPPVGWRYCYVGRDCSGYLSGGMGEECIYPQVFDQSLNQGRGRCFNGVSYSAQFCTYDDDCISGYFCSVTFNDNFIESPVVDCTNTTPPYSCSDGYQCTEHQQTFASYSNALSTNPEDANGYASVLKLENPAAPLINNKLGFPLFLELDPTERSNIHSMQYDPDNPNIDSNNPINGCFNCYKQKTFVCSGSGAACSCSDPQANSCNSADCVGGVDDRCVLVETKNFCDNCLEYFYYTENDFPKVCDNSPGTICTSDASCPSGGTCRQTTSGNKCVALPDETPALGCTLGVNCPAIDTEGIRNSCESRSIGNIKKVLMGYNCFDCTVENFGNSCELNSYNKNINRCKSCLSVLRVPGLTLDNEKDTIVASADPFDANQYGRLCGWSFNGVDKPASAYNSLLGWIQFSPRITTSTNPYFSVDRGSIYSKNRIVSPYYPPFGKYNASYIIESGGNIVNFISSSTATGLFTGELSNRPYIDFLQPVGTDNKFANALGKLDYKGLITPAKTDGVTGKKYNKYGSEILEFIDSDGIISTNDSSGFGDQFTAPLNGKVLYVAKNASGNASLYVQNVLTILAGSGNTSGAGIIVVDGNLHIDRNIDYGSSANLTNLKQIPSLVWVVRGDIKVDPSVTKIAGTFIALGKPTIANCSAGVEGCGRFVSGFYYVGSPSLSNQLVVVGNVLAKKFILNRTYIDPLTGAPAEQFINDGRLQTNPPPGMTDLSKVIPRFTH
ncbi:MAG: hypothetical protein WC465_02835 [Patescibacteria group bacterium]